MKFDSQEKNQTIFKKATNAKNYARKIIFVSENIFEIKKTLRLKSQRLVHYAVVKTAFIFSAV